MRILLSNDDGYFAPGLAVLAEALSKHAEIIVVAPERDRSGASNSLTLDRPLQVRHSHNGFHYVNGTPTDCVHLAVTGMLDRDRKSTRLNSSHQIISYAVFCLRSKEHTSELQSPDHLVCRLLLEK